MERKRICEDCGNICNDVNCPICGRKTKVYAGSRQEDTLYDASKYRMSDNTGCTKKEQKKKEYLNKKLAWMTMEEQRSIALTMWAEKIYGCAWKKGGTLIMSMSEQGKISML